MLLTKFNLLFSSVLFSFALAIYFFIIAPSDDSAGLWTRYSAHLSFLYLIAAYSVSILKDTFNFDAINNLATNRRYFGLSFSITHSVHLAALIYFFYTNNENPELVSILGGGLGYLLMYAMTLTSTDAMVKRIGIKNWKMLHATGVNYLVIIFFYTFSGSMIETSLYSTYTVYVLVILIIWMLKIIKFAKS
ncbi:methyltransferase TrmFO protein [Candidatus Micropelagos thuwalensis]|uniref:Methyltransferase TrmFO protein n=1 Tax=Candidatus Micropelagius thuwalensis TaxID=1397666 RepID=U2WD22_9PROT|nr:ferric reductase-like transmembrane domain-containing protein [Candidatus Micropelagos thuwalensis]ERL47434.1 methyltransferase TrmFO protein [Candidatus Micropelagos thuwalensis]